MLALTCAAQADTMRLAVYAAPLSRDGPGLLLRDISDGEDAQIMAIIGVIAQTAPDVLLLTDFDYDDGLITLAAFNDALTQTGQSYQHLLALPPNSGMTTGLDMNGNGRLGEAGDAQGYGRFFGDGGMALLSKHAILEDEVQDFSSMLWRDLPDAVLPELGGAPFPSEEAQAVQRLSSTAHWAVPLDLGDERRVTLLMHDATAPIFDGPEDMNGLRNRDELRLWQVYLDGRLGAPPVATPVGPVVIMGNFNLDPVDGEGLRDVLQAVLSDPRLQDPQPSSPGAAVADDPGHAGDPAHDTVNWRAGAPGNLRVSYILPDAGLRVSDAGVFWPAPDDPLASMLGEDGLLAGSHRLVWTDILWPQPP